MCSENSFARHLAAVVSTMAVSVKCLSFNNKLDCPLGDESLSSAS